MNQTHTVSPQTVRAHMTPHPSTVDPGTELAEIATLLTERGISGVPVVDGDGGVLGVVSEADLIAARQHPHARRGHGLRLRRQHPAQPTAPKARELMSRPALVIEADSPLPTAARMLSRTGVRRLCVVDGGRLVGVLSRRDLVRSFVRPDNEIHQQVLSGVFGDGLGMPPTSIGVAVEHGVVLLLGRLSCKSDVDRATTLTERIPGVMEVRNRLDFVWDDRHSRQRSHI